MNGILGKKLGMTQLFQDDGTCLPVTVLQAGPCKVLQVKVADTAELPDDQQKASTNHGKKRGKSSRARRADGYYAVQLGFDEKPEKSASKPELGHARKAKVTPQRFVREIRCDALPEHKQGDEVTLAVLDGVKRVDVTGTTKGRGFAGTIKRWNFARQATTHAIAKPPQARWHRPPVFDQQGRAQGKKMCGHYGVERVTTQNLEVVKVDTERNLIYVRGAVPGHRSAYVVVQRSVKNSRN